ncbi:MAG: hypothetical protein IIW48_05030 [Clostridia bacterium]|nr:hypothetical protein [Clostridia bacterium]
MKKKAKIVISIIVALAIITVGCIWYMADGYKPYYPAMTEFLISNKIVVQTIQSDTNKTVYTPAESDCGLIFYPGARIEHEAYEPLMKACAVQGIKCILVEMPLNMAFFNINAADNIQKMYPEIEHWYIGGHSLGGAMASLYLENNINKFDGLILLGSYSTADLSAADIDVLSVYGTEDEIMNADKYNANKINLPEDFEEHIIKGGCHAYFGMYGKQSGDGTPTITNEEQIKYTAQLISKFINESVR